MMGYHGLREYIGLTTNQVFEKVICSRLWGYPKGSSCEIGT